MGSSGEKAEDSNVNASGGWNRQQKREAGRDFKRGKGDWDDAFPGRHRG